MEAQTARKQNPDVTSHDFRCDFEILGRSFKAEVEYDFDHRADRLGWNGVEVQAVTVVGLIESTMWGPVTKTITPITFDASELTQTDLDYLTQLAQAAHDREVAA
jgi:hypothetical protein